MIETMRFIREKGGEHRHFRAMGKGKFKRSIEGAPNHVCQSLGGEGLLNEAIRLRPGLEKILGCALVVTARHDHGNLRVDFADMRKGLLATHDRHREIQKDGVDVLMMFSV